MMPSIALKKVPPILDGEDDGDARKELGEEPSDAVHEAGSDEVEDRVYGEVEPYRPVLFKDLGVEVPKSKNEEEQDEQQPAEISIAKRPEVVVEGHDRIEHEHEHKEELVRLPSVAGRVAKENLRVGHARGFRHRAPPFSSPSARQTASRYA